MPFFKLSTFKILFSYLLEFYIIIVLLCFVFFMFCFICYVKFTPNAFKENFEAGGGGDAEGNKWSSQTIQDFISFEKTINPKVVFDLDLLQKQATEDEAKTLIQTGMWPWNSSIQQFYMENVQNNPIIKTNPEDSMKQARTIYNQTIMSEMLSWNTPEGQFLMSGVFVKDNVKDDPKKVSSFAHNSGLVSLEKDKIVCDTSSSPSSPSGPSLKRVQPKGFDGITQVQLKSVEPISYQDLPNLVPSFSFLKEPCNPCLALQNPPNYSCPFSLQKDKQVSSIWKYLWQI